MTPRRRKPTKPVGGGGARHPNSLANLVPGAGAGDGGLQRRLSHGGYAQLHRERIERKEREVYDALAADAPLRDSNGELPRHDAAQVALLCECLCHLEDVSANIRDFGVLEQHGKRKGQPRTVVEVARTLRREAAGYLAELGMTPKARAALGVDLQRTVDLATAMSHPDPERRDQLLREAGLDEEHVLDG
jgi:Phage terminase, small subunit